MILSRSGSTVPRGYDKLCVDESVPSLILRGKCQLPQGAVVPIEATHDEHVASRVEQELRVRGLALIYNLDHAFSVAQGCDKFVVS